MTSTVPPRVSYQGIWPALLTPLDANLDIDIPAFATHALKLLDAGCMGVTPFGTTGEGPSFNVAERLAANSPKRSAPVVFGLAQSFDFFGFSFSGQCPGITLKLLAQLVFAGQHQAVFAGKQLCAFVQH